MSDALAGADAVLVALVHFHFQHPPLESDATSA